VEKTPSSTQTVAYNLNYILLPVILPNQANEVNQVGVANKNHRTKAGLQFFLHEDKFQ
jgi:hypothetical protein